MHIKGKYFVNYHVYNTHNQRERKGDPQTATSTYISHSQTLKRFITTTKTGVNRSTAEKIMKKQKRNGKQTRNIYEMVINIG